jgi:putative endonuclease
MMGAMVRNLVTAKTSYGRGLRAEILAMLYLTIKGYTILAWRYKTSVGEVDIIAKRGTSIRFCEVKLRPSFDDGLEAISPYSQQRIARAASHFMVSKPGFQGYQQQFDAIVVCGWRIRHLDNAWMKPT